MDRGKKKIIFRNKEHEDFYWTHFLKCRYQDVFRRIIRRRRLRRSFTVFWIPGGQMGVGKEIGGSFVPWWQKGNMEILCHGGRK